MSSEQYFRYIQYENKFKNILKLPVYKNEGEFNDFWLPLIKYWELG